MGCPGKWKAGLEPAVLFPFLFSGDLILTHTQIVREGFGAVGDLTWTVF